MEFSYWSLDNSKDDSFLSHLLMSDEAHFYLNGFVNKQNCRIWAIENKHVVKECASHGFHVSVVQSDDAWNCW